MKRCPECRRDYYDDSLLYCLDDGIALLEGPTSLRGLEEPLTAILHETASPNEAATRAQIHTTAHNEPGPSPTAGPKRNSLVFGLLGILLMALLGVGGYWIYGRGAKQIGSIAVMPFTNDSGDASLDYLSDGMTETLISSLSQLPSLNVKPRAMVFRYKGKDVDVQKAGNDLGCWRW